MLLSQRLSDKYISRHSSCMLYLEKVCQMTVHMEGRQILGQVSQGERDEYAQPNLTKPWRTSCITTTNILNSVQSGNSRKRQSLMSLPSPCYMSSYSHVILHHVHRGYRCPWPYLLLACHPKPHDCHCFRCCCMCCRFRGFVTAVTNLFWLNVNSTKPLRTSVRQDGQIRLEIGVSYARQ